MRATKSPRPTTGSTMGQTAGTTTRASKAQNAADASPTKKIEAKPAVATSNASDATPKTQPANVFLGMTSTAPEVPAPTSPQAPLPLQAKFHSPPSNQASTTAAQMPALDVVTEHVVPGAPKAATLLETLKAVDDATLMTLLAERFTAQKTASEKSPRPRLALGPQFVDVGRLVPGQTRISLDRVREKVASQIEFGGYTQTPSHALALGFGDGTATVPLSRPKPAIAGPFGQVLVIDGNHQAVASILAGAKTTPIDIVADYQDLSQEAFDALAAKNGWTYLNAIGGGPPTTTPSYAALTNDPVRFLMSEAAFKASPDAQGRTVFEDVERPQTRAWVKLLDRSVDFVEFKLADILYRAAERDPALKDALLVTGDEALTARGPVVHQALNAAVVAGELDPQALGIMVLETPVKTAIDLEALALAVQPALAG